MQSPFFRRATSAVALVAVCGLTACVTQPQQPYQQPYPAPGYQNQGYNQGYNNQNNAPYGTEYGRVVNIQALQSQSNTSGAGAVLGAVVGGVLGNQVGKGGVAWQPPPWVQSVVPWWATWWRAATAPTKRRATA